MQEKKDLWRNFGNFLGRFLVLAIIILFLFNIGRSIWKNHQVKSQISQLESAINSLENEKLNLQNRIIYYNTDTYKELEARKHLCYKKKGEKVVVLVKNEEKQNVLHQPGSTTAPQEKKGEDSSHNWQKWWQYIFG